jgi:acetyl-CoA acetyltransferase
MVILLARQARWLTTRLLHSIKRDGLKRGVVTLCIGGGQGIALALETVQLVVFGIT